ncbi:phospholipase [Sinomonas sp. ASV322]|uniref:alpha/beta hydrolase n=1 Tax=Sinomonas sp. ASV322 TaxID=3041920 RepID=UPI0027DE7795|nr:phospholipase [Sinomonas sp. ASV322]MDQ4501326.1 phospholipase [Sinomonas sp. ASV322]
MPVRPLDVVWSRPEGQREGTPLVVLLHGYGSNPESILAAAGGLPPEFTLAAPRGPLDVGGDRGWFLLDYFLANDFAEVMATTTAVQAWVNTVRAAHSSVALLGFSQGMALASTLVRLKPEAFSAVVGLSGFVLDNEILSLTESLPEPPAFFWGRDPDDVVIHPDAVEATAEWLDSHTRLTARRYPGMGHRIGRREIADVSVFLRHYVLNARH